MKKTEKITKQSQKLPKQIDTSIDLMNIAAAVFKLERRIKLRQRAKDKRWREWHSSAKIYDDGGNQFLGGWSKNENN